MTHEPIHTVHLTPHITWQGTQAELEANRLANRVAIMRLEANLDKALSFIQNFAYRAKECEHSMDEKFLLDLSSLLFDRDCDITLARTTLAELIGETDE